MDGSCMRVKRIVAALLVLATGFSIIGLSVSEEPRARMNLSKLKKTNHVEDTQIKISKEVSKYLGTFKAVETIEVEPLTFVPSSLSVVDYTDAQGLPTRYKVVVSTADDRMVSLRLIESNGSFALLPE
jgi:hypothetical protein